MKRLILLVFLIVLTAYGFMLQGKGHIVADSACTGWYGEGNTTTPTADAITDDIRAYPFTTTCTGTPTGVRIYNRYTSTPDDSIIVFAYGDTSGEPDTSNLLFTSEEGDDSGGAPDWSATLSLTGASEIAVATKIWLCVWDEAGATVYYQTGSEPYYYKANVTGYPTLPSSGSFTEGGSDRDYLIQVTYD